MYRLFAKYIVSFCVHAVFLGHAYSQELKPKIFVALFDGIDQKYVSEFLALDSITLQLENKKILSKLRNDGYWLASIDSIVYINDTVRVRGFQGRKFKNIDVSIIDSKGAIDKFPHLPRLKPNQISSPVEVESHVDLLLSYLESNGYPFASLSIDSSVIENGVLHTQLLLDIGTKITYDSLVVDPPDLVNHKFLSKYLELDYGKNYDEQNLIQIQDKIQHLPFLTLNEVSTSFQLKKAGVSLQIEPNKVNYFDGILGLVPGQDGEGVEVTGELDLSINNLFRSGKKVEINWKKLEPGSQQLHASYLHPILLGSPLDFYFSLDLVRQDTIYSNRSLQLAFDYRPSRRLSMRVSYENLLGNELEDTEGTSGDFNIDYYGLAVSWYKLDHLFNPKNGFKTQWITNIGRKSVSGGNSSIPESTQYRLQAILEWYKRVSPRSVFYIASQNGAIFNDYLYLNDLFRLGGLKTIRGFNELEFFASHYALINMEWRFYLDSKSYLVAFYDQSILSYEIQNVSFSDRPAGLGTGMQFETERGNFKILYGLGKRKGESLSFATSKIHFGYTAIF